MRNLLWCVVLIISSISAIAQHETKSREYAAYRVTTSAPEIDGILNDDVWKTGKWESNFTQHEPYDGKPPSQQTAFKIAYDNEYLYVAIKAFDTQIDSIDKRMARRDEMDGDFVGIQLDSYHDKLTAFSFIVTAAGVKIDMFVSDNGNNEDMTWDAIWNVKTHIDKDGWNAEMAIPLTQLRFSANENQIWGMQVVRFIYRKEEMSLWQYIPRDAPGWVHLFGEMNGLKGIKTRRQVEILPYTVAKIESFENEDGDPFTNLSTSNLSVGLDGKIGITNDFTLDFTVNPDFGQVEADPSQVNLSAYETYFQEKRPFFIEGKNIISFSATPGNSPASSDNLFYSRRIGRRPQYEYETNDNEYVNAPNNTTILGAFKVTGKTKNGLSVGIMESVTAKEYAKIDLYGDRRNITTEPLTNYFVTRIQKDINKGNTQIGAMITSTNRKLDDEHLNFLHKAAYTGGIDFTQHFKSRTYYVNVKLMASQVQGSKEAISETQLSSARYFQRPGADYMQYDPDRTKLNGQGGIVTLGKSGSGKFKFMTWVTWRSPGLELNDVGFIRRADDIMQVFWAGYNIYEPFSIFRRMNININQWTGLDFGGTTKFYGGNVNANTQFKNFWGTGAGINYDVAKWDNSLLRGGPAFKSTNGLNVWGFVDTDEKKKLRFELFGMRYWGQFNSADMINTGIEIGYRPSNAFSMEIEPEFSHNQFILQYIDEQEYNGERQYIFGHLNQKTISASIRLNYSVTPNLTIQYYGQPFISAGKFTNYKMITNPTASEFESRYEILPETKIEYNKNDELFWIDHNADGISDYSFDDPNYNALEFKSNLVMRWEYIPGSVVYVVWSQNKGDYYSNGYFNFNNNVEDLVRLHPHNIFLIKFSYRFRL